MLRVRDKAAQFCESHFGRRLVPINSIISAVGLFRVIAHIESCFQSGPLTVFEVGPGAGYLGAFLIETGHRYISMDTTQAFYLWQSRFFHYFAGDAFVEQAFVKTGESPPAGHVTHIPWWHFVSNIGEAPIRADVVVCEQAISEMHAWASRYTALTAKGVLADSEVKVFLFSDFGHPTVPPVEIEGMFGEYQYSRVLSKRVYAFTPGQYQLPPGFYSLDEDIPLYNPSGRPRLLAAPEFLKVKRCELPLDYEFRRFLVIWPHAEQFLVD